MIPRMKISSMGPYERAWAERQWAVGYRYIVFPPIDDGLDPVYTDTLESCLSVAKIYGDGAIAYELEND